MYEPGETISAIGQIAHDWILNPCYEHPLLLLWSYYSNSVEHIEILKQVLILASELTLIPSGESNFPAIDSYGCLILNVIFNTNSEVFSQPEAASLLKIAQDIVYAQSRAGTLLFIPYEIPIADTDIRSEIQLKGEVLSWIGAYQVLLKFANLNRMSNRIVRTFPT